MDISLVSEDASLVRNHLVAKKKKLLHFILLAEKSQKTD